jgi:hypothetical protein
MIYQSGHFTCYQKRTFSLANDISALAVIRPEPRNRLSTERLQGCGGELPADTFGSGFIRDLRATEGTRLIFHRHNRRASL